MRGRWKHSGGVGHTYNVKVNLGQEVPNLQPELPDLIMEGLFFWVFFFFFLGGGGSFFFFAFPWFFLGKTAVSLRFGRIWRDFPWFSTKKQSPLVFRGKTYITLTCVVRYRFLSGQRLFYHRARTACDCLWFSQEKPTILRAKSTSPCDFPGNKPFAVHFGLCFCCLV